ncbi:hypothetical protein FFK22_009000 [Mycobacterium sp. KBS0706]|uniref:hypothetical protein n=1 Tax=Mycobacterium sp. KBS0706 TaxID=2578109 RepID=UPI00110FB3CD|nr:hypothetical protein [Mycobacterium sp. KBS0706]TSD89106.1 hypothetical protein FFK22_009000 [Mycobacterium sp. KBS0706]
MTDRPIIFSAPMIRALLDGRKTQTRRLINKTWAKAAPGDRLWVKESCADEHPLSIQDGRYSQLGRAGIPGPPPVNYRTIYRIDGEPLQVWRSGLEHPYFSLSGPADDIAAKHPTVCSNYTRANGKGIHWSQARFMPRWASRLTLIVEAVKVEPLQAISKADAIAEGIARNPVQEGTWIDYPEGTSAAGWEDPRESFRSLWSSIHGDFVWWSNPDVVALTFCVVRANIDHQSAAA